MSVAIQLHKKSWYESSFASLLFPFYNNFPAQDMKWSSNIVFKDSGHPEVSLIWGRIQLLMNEDLAWLHNDALFLVLYFHSFHTFIFWKTSQFNLEKATNGFPRLWSVPKNSFPTFYKFFILRVISDSRAANSPKGGNCTKFMHQSNAIDCNLDNNIILRREILLPLW